MRLSLQKACHNLVPFQIKDLQARMRGDETSNSLHNETVKRQ
jgi:hypothetical protein